MHPLGWPDEQPTLIDGDLTLRPWRVADVDQITAACQDRLVTRFTRVPTPYRRPHAIEYVTSSAGEWAHGTAASFCLADSERPDIVHSSVGLVRIDRGERIGEIGYWTAPAHRGHGLTARAVRFLARRALQEWELDRIELMADIANIASHGVARSAGFQHEGTLRDRLLLRGVRRDAEMFSLIMRDFD